MRWKLLDETNTFPPQNGTSFSADSDCTTKVAAKPSSNLLHMPLVIIRMLAEDVRT